MTHPRNVVIGILVLAGLAGVCRGQAPVMDLPEHMSFSEDGTQLLLGDQAEPGLYDESVLRRIDLTFTQDDWWAQLTANYISEQEIPADLTVDGITYPGVGVRFKGMTSYSMAGNSQKKSFNISMDFTDPDQRLMGYKTLNLHNAHTDATFMREALYFDALRRYAPAPKASFVKLSINGENWGIYVHVQQLNSDLIAEWFLNSDGNRWKVGMIGGPGGRQVDGAILPTLEEWLADVDATDLNGDGQIDEADYTLFVAQQQPGGQQPGGQLPGGQTRQPTLEQWLAGPAAVDLNDDGQIDEADYALFVAQQQPGGQQPGGQLPGGQTQQPTLEQWLAGPAAVDLNDDGKVDEADYNLFVAQQQPGTQPDDGGLPGGDGGFAGGDGALTWFGSDPAAYEAVYELKSAHTPDPWACLVTACDVLNNTSADQLADTLETVLAVDRWLWFLAAENIFTDSDSYLIKGWDYQLYYDEVTGQIHPLEHDGNESFGARSAQQNPMEGEDNPNRPVISRLLSVPAWRQRYLAHIRTILDESFDWRVLAPKVAQYRALVEGEVKADTKKLYSNDAFDSGLTELETLVNTRRDYLLNHGEINRSAPEIVSVARRTAQDASPAAGQTVQVTAQIGGSVGVSQVTLCYADGLMGSFSRARMFDDGGHGDGEAGDGIYGADIPTYPAGSVVRYYVEAQADDDVGTVAFAPAGAEYDVFAYQVSIPVASSTPVVINEFMASNATTTQDPQEEYDDWIELLNVSDQEVDLSGMYLTDKEDNLRKWTFPEGTALAPGAYLIVWADEDGVDEPGLHANFRLSSGGESIMLVDVDERGNLLLDSVRFETQETDISCGRFPNGTGRFQMLVKPTPGVENTPVLRSEDFDGDGDVGFSDFLCFAQQFGKGQGDPDFDARCDLDKDGIVGFSDFVRFAQQFGVVASSRPTGVSKPVGTASGANADAALRLTTQSGKESGLMQVTVGLTGAEAVMGYSLQVIYDPAELTFVSAEGAGASLFGTEGNAHSVALQISPAPGKVLLADMLQSDATVYGDGDLLRLLFRTTGGDAFGNVEAAEALVSDDAGRIDALSGVSLAGQTPLPVEFALEPNIPNPFNPDTQIAYQLPEAGDIRMVIYSPLGQEVRTLVQAHQEAGFYRVVWDGRDSQGRQVSSGIYFARLQAYGFSRIRKMLLLK